MFSINGFTDMEHFGNSSQMAGEVSFCPLRHSFSAPSNQSILGQRCIWVFDFDESKLNTAVGEFVDQIDQITFYTRTEHTLKARVGCGRHVPPVLWTFSTLSLPPASWVKALTRGADTEKTAHCPKVGDLAALAEAGDALIMD